MYDESCPYKFPIERTYNNTSRSVYAQFEHIIKEGVASTMYSAGKCNTACMEVLT